MAQMPASYLAEKVDDLRASLARLDSTNGLVELDDRHLRLLADMVRNAQAIVDEITLWTGADA